MPVDDQWRARFSDAVPAWNDWWSMVLRLHAVAPTALDALLDAVVGAKGAMRSLLETVVPASEAWARDLDRSRALRPPPHSTPYGLWITPYVREIEERLGRPAAPFHLDIITLPVRGMWSRSTAAGLLLSDDLRADPPEMERVVRPVVAALV